MNRGTYGVGPARAQRSRFLLPTKRSAASEDENPWYFAWFIHMQNYQMLVLCGSYLVRTVSIDFSLLSTRVTGLLQFPRQQKVAFLYSCGDPDRD